MPGQSLTRKRIINLIDDYRGKAKALETALELLDGAAIQVKAPKHPAMFQKALAIEAERVGRPPGRQKRADLSHLTPEQKRAHKNKLNRESKARRYDLEHGRGTQTVSERLERRKRSAAMLTHFSPNQTTTAKDLANAGVLQADRRLLGVLVRYGYLKRQGKGYVRTAAEFTP